MWPEEDLGYRIASGIVAIGFIVVCAVIGLVL